MWPVRQDQLLLRARRQCVVLLEPKCRDFMYGNPHGSSRTGITVPQTCVLHRFGRPVRRSVPTGGASTHCLWLLFADQHLGPRLAQSYGTKKAENNAYQQVQHCARWTSPVTKRCCSVAWWLLYSNLQPRLMEYAGPTIALVDGDSVG